MFDLEKLVFDQLFELVSGVIDNKLKASGFSYLEQRKIKSRIENACVDFVESLLPLLKRENLSPEKQERLIKICLKELKPLTENPAELCETLEGEEIFDHLYYRKSLPQVILEDNLEETYSLLLPRIATFLCKISVATVAKNETWLENFRRFDEIAAQLKALFSQTEDMARNIPKEATQPPTGENISFDIPFELEETAAPAEEVSFTALYPREIGGETWNTLLVYAHLSSAIESIHKDAERFKDQILAPKEVTVPASTPLARGTEITIVPRCEGIMFNPQRISLAWLEDFHRADFRFKADKSLAEDAARGSVDIYVGPLIIGTLKLALLVSENPPENVAPQEEQGAMYHQDDIFISYSHKDTEIILGFKKAYEAIGDNVLIDIDDLRSGQEWNAELLKMIERAEIFQLFWSENSSQSKYCRQEWEYALKLNKGTGFIRPCYWQNPMPAPPTELGHLHFEYVPV